MKRKLNRVLALLVAMMMATGCFAVQAEDDAPVGVEAASEIESGTPGEAQQTQDEAEIYAEPLDTELLFAAEPVEDAVDSGELDLDGDEIVEEEWDLGDDDAQDGETIILSESMSVAPYAGGADNDALLDAYVRRMIDQSLGKTPKLPAFSAQENLTGIDWALYDILKEEVVKSAAGEEGHTSTIIISPRSELEKRGVSCGPFSAEDLGVDSIMQA
ncbi:MAG: hypothetical protein IJH86_01650, partial [Clostridia bacterium]|nr:hypothetical protein [Clostridia bacterium]